MSSTVEGSGAGRANGGLGTPRTSEGCKRWEEELCRVGSQSFPTWAAGSEGAWDTGPGAESKAEFIWGN